MRGSERYWLQKRGMNITGRKPLLGGFFGLFSLILGQLSDKLAEL